MLFKTDVKKTKNVSSSVPSPRRWPAWPCLVLTTKDLLSRNIKLGADKLPRHQRSLSSLL